MLNRAATGAEINANLGLLRQIGQMAVQLDTTGAEQPWLSVIVPSHNGERWLGAALQSVVNQNDGGIEAVIIDSSDDEGSFDILRRYGDRLPIRAWRRLDLLPWTQKTNVAAGLARADWISMLHQDDLWVAGRAAAVRRWLGAAPAAIMHLHSAYIIDNDGRRRGVWRCPLGDGDHAVPARLLLERLLVQNFIAMPAPTIRRDAYLTVGGLDGALWYTADWDLYLKLATTGPVHYHDQPLASYRIHGNSLTSSGSRDLDGFRAQMQTVLERHIGRLGSEDRDLRRVAMASIDVNVALAAASAGKYAGLPAAMMRLLALGPRRLRRYLRDSCILERLYPRVRARLAGAL
jgi:glycosyltransferase involved in cell wall biosynthesis